MRNAIVNIVFYSLIAAGFLFALSLLARGTV